MAHISRPPIRPKFQRLIMTGFCPCNAMFFDKKD